MKNMKKIVMIIAILSVVTLIATAQTYTPQTNNQAIQSQQIMQKGALYQGTVYEPFGESAPSEYHPVAAGDNSSARTIRRFPKPGETGQSEAYPLGDGLWPLLLCAAAFSLIISLRRKKRAE